MVNEGELAIGGLLRRHALGSVAELTHSLLALIAASDVIVMAHYNKDDPLAIETKADDSPVTEADQAVHDFLLAALRELSPQIPVLSEESPAAALLGRRDWPSCWMLDPLDGTKEFIARTGEFTTNLALIHAGRPVLGLISVPCQQHIYVGVPGLGAWRYASLAPPGGDGQRLNTRRRQRDRPLIMLASSRHARERVAAVMQGLEPLGTPVERHNAGSAIKFCALVEGEADVYPRTSPCFEWDVAAGDALVTAAGGRVIGTDGEPLRYNDGETLLAPRFIAAADPTTDYLAQLSALI